MDIKLLPKSDAIEAFSDAVALRWGCTPLKTDHPLAAFVGEHPLTLKTFAMATRNGSVSGLLSSSDLSDLVDGLTKRLALDSGTADLSHRSVAKLFEVPDFRPATLIRLGAGGEMRERREGSPAQHAPFAVSGESVRIRDYAEFGRFSRAHALDAAWDVLAAMVSELTTAAYRSERTALVAVLEDNGALADGTPLFAESRGNLLAAGSVDAAGVGAMVSALKALAGEAGQAMQLAPGVLCVPGTQDLAARTLLEQAALSGTVTVFSDTRLTSAYLLPNPQQTPVVGLAHLQGESAPLASTAKNKRTDSWAVKIVHTFAAAAVSPRAVKLPLS